ncbi:MAG: hypothetical protein Fur0022_34440 [Anaerolineales bacterium]
MNDPIIFIATAFGGMLGLLFGGLIGFLIGRRNRKGSETKVTEVVPAPPPPAPPSTPLRNTPKDSVELLSLWRNERTHKLIAMLETKPLSPSHLTSEQKSKMSQLLTSLHSMIGDAPPAPPPPPVASPPKVETRVPEPVVTPALEHATPREASPLAESEADPGVSEPVQEQVQKVYFADTLPEPVTIGQALLSNPFKISPPPTPQKPAGAPKSIVEQIDEIFQSKLVGTPYENQNIQLKESLNGMTIIIGTYKYEGIDAVPDATIRGLIKESAREWNEKVSRKR